MLITAHYLVQTEGHLKPHGEVGSESPAKHISGI